MIYGTNKWLTATVALSTTCCGAAMAADLTVASGNTQVFDGSAAFPGGVDVNGGTLVIGGNGGGAGVTLTGNVNAAANGTVSGFGAINGNLNVNGARVAPGYPVGTPTGVSNGNLVVRGDLSMNNAVFDFETGYAGLPITQPGTGDNITVAGNATLNNTTLNVSVNTLGTNAGYYRILSYGGTLSGNGLTLGSVTGDSQPAATIQSLTGDKQINLILGPSTTNLWNGNGAASATRAGGGNGTWSAASGNWNSPANATGALPDGGYAIFTGAAGTVTVDGGAGPVRVSGIQFATDRYTVQGAPITLVGSGGNPPALVVGDGTYASGQFVDTIHNPLQGTQGFVKTGPGSLILTADSSGLSGPILIADGALEIDGKLNGPLDIGREVVLAGVGQVGTTTLYPTAVISPGNDGSPIGTLTVNGNLTFGADTVYRVHADPASSASDRIHVTGVATLDGTVAHVGPAGNYAPRTTYNILTADGGIQGRFTGASSAYAFLTPTLSYDAKNAFMTLTRNDVPIGSIGGTGNEASVGGALDQEDPPASGNGSTSGGNASASSGNGATATGNGSSVVGSGTTAAAGTGARQVTTAVLTMTPNEARSALKQLSGEAYASTATVLQSQADSVRAAAGSPARQPRRAGARRTADRPTGRAVGRRAAAKRRLAGLGAGLRQLEHLRWRRQRLERQPIVRRPVRRRRWRGRRRLAPGRRGRLHRQPQLAGRFRLAHRRRQLHRHDLRRPQFPGRSRPPALHGRRRLHLARHQHQARRRGRQPEPAPGVVLPRLVDAAFQRARLPPAAERCLQHRTLCRAGLEPAAHAGFRGIGRIGRAARQGPHRRRDQQHAGRARRLAVRIQRRAGPPDRLAGLAPRHGRRHAQPATGLRRRRHVLGARRADRQERRGGRAGRRNRARPQHHRRRRL